MEGHNELLLQMLIVLEPLVSYGFLDNNTNEITNILVGIIDENCGDTRSSMIIVYVVTILYNCKHTLSQISAFSNENSMCVL